MKKRDEHVILLGVSVEGDSREDAERFLHEIFPSGIVQGDREHFRNATRREVSWWVAEDERYDGSDNYSAVFVPPNIPQTVAASALQTLSETEGDGQPNVKYGPRPSGAQGLAR